jgi:hypothetical protein
MVAATPKDNSFIHSGTAEVKSRFRNLNCTCTVRCYGVFAQRKPMISVRISGSA